MNLTQIAVVLVVLTLALGFGVVLGANFGQINEFGTVDLTEEQVLDLQFEGEYEEGDIIEDASSNENHGELIGNASNESGGAMELSSETGHVRVDLGDDVENDFTLTANVRNDEHGYYAGIVDGGGWRLVAPYDRYEFSNDDAGVCSEMDDDGEWHYITIVRQDESVRMYVNGDLVDSSPGADKSATNELFIGQRSGGYEFEGEISAVTLHDRALSTPEVRGMYADRSTVWPILYSDAFRSATALALGAIALLAARIEWRGRTT